MSLTIPKLRRFLAILACNFGILALGLLVLEAFFGNWWGQNPMIRLRVPQNLVILKDISGIYPAPKPVVFYKRDRYGLRGKFPNYESIDILSIGGSTTAQDYIGDGETWQNVLAADFAKEGKKIYIANSGVDGHTSYSHIRSFKLWFSHIPGLKPRYVIAYVGMNDVYLYPGLYKDELLDSFSLMGYFKRKSALFLLYRYLRSYFIYWHTSSRQRFEKMTGHFERTGPIRLTEEDKRTVERNAKSYERRLRILVKKIREWGAEPILVTQKEESYKIVDGKIQGFRYVDSEGNVQVNDLTDQIMMTLNGVTLRVCKEMGGICIDLAKELDLSPDDFYDSTHTTPEGSQKIGHFLYQKLKSHL